MNKGKKQVKPETETSNLPEMTDESGKSHREHYIKLGLIVPSELGGTSQAQDAAAYRQKLIDTGLLKPGAGWHRLKKARAPKAFRPRNFQ